MNFEVFLVSLILMGSFSGAVEDEDIESFVSVPLNHENYDKILKSKPLVLVKFFTNWFVAF